MFKLILKRVKPKILSQEGTAAMMVISIIAILSIMAAGMSTIIVNEMQMIVQYQNRTRAYYVAQAGIAHALWEINTGGGGGDGDITTPISLGQGSYHTDYTNGVLRSWGTVNMAGNQVERRISVKVNAETYSTTWTTQGDFENNDVTGQGATTRSQVDTSSSPGDVKLNQSYSLAYAQTTNPGTSNDVTQAITADSTGIYVAGDDSSLGSSNRQWRIEKRNLTTGAFILGFGTSGVVTSNPSTNYDSAKAITADSTGIYVAGYDFSPGAGNSQWRIEKRNLTTGALIWTQTSNPSTGWDGPLAIIADSSGIYVVGYDEFPGAGNFQWRIEKRNLTTGALISGFGTSGVVTSNPSTSTDNAQAIIADSTGIYVAGDDSSLGSSNRQWRIEKRNLTTGALIWTQTSNPSTNYDIAFAITVDSTGVYAAGYDSSLGFSNSQWRIEKRNLTTGALISGFGTSGVVTSNPSTSGDNARAIIADSSGIHVAGYDSSPGAGNSQWRIEKRNLTTGALIWTQTSNPSTNYDIAFAITVDSTGIYVAGDDSSLGSSNRQWRIEKYAFTYLSPGTLGETGTGLRFDAGAGIKARWSSLDWAGSGLSPNYMVGFQIRAYDSFGGGTYVNPYTNLAGNWYEISSGTSGNIPISSSVAATQTLEIKVRLTSTDGTNTPVLSSLTLNYEAPPVTLDYATWRSN